MKFWTVQKRALVDQALKEGEYQPIFELSYYTRIMRGLDELYEIFRNAYRDVNGVEVPGLVFAFTKMEGKHVSQFNDIDDFRAYMKEHKASILSLWIYFRSNDMVVVELEVPDEFNPIYIDINDFQFLMPPVIYPKPYTPATYMEIMDNITRGDIQVSVFPSGIGQAHLPSIKRENIVKVYDMFSI